MPQRSDIEVVVFDVLGTLVDEPTGVRSTIRDTTPQADDAMVERLYTVWQRHREREQQRIADGDRPYVNSGILDAEAARCAAEQVGLDDPATVTGLATAGWRLPPWGDSVACVERLGRHLPVLGLSNASRATLLRLNALAGLRWHQVLSGETVSAYKPAPEVYQLAVDTAGCPPERILMVAAHAWDLRGAQSCGMRTAYVQRPVGDPPTASDTIDWLFSGLDELVAALLPG
ncbi:haloacid dehalogenase type II [Saccharomonospora xinjiangensis]|uniref:2-haloalkanoic acid dehalogenase, type II n=1 Tax=Saccharomonospora xinjiangensis XJ-54 TaxID=882086 RepID=I0V2D6_9PSEU|nr:haloacid dehalogenase type II [Saccharomonospora xinjiangensis]EID54289.1 2-haloalkanoic acid dehalogenase, type II [Saccharomonospora xinjiangensis XJ-54]